MVILSSFNADYLKDTFQFLINHFVTDEKIEIKYGNIILSLINFKEARDNRAAVILFRLADLIKIDKKEINTSELEKNIKLLTETISKLKEHSTLQLIVVLCPSLETSLFDNLEFLEDFFYNAMQDKAIPFINASEIQRDYSLLLIDNVAEKETHIPYIPKFYTALACVLARTLHNLLSKPHKVIVVDCDNTLWSGIVGDVGADNIVIAEHNRLLQEFLLKQYAEGMLICLSSKNNEQSVLDVFTQNQSNMLLKLEHISKFKINWQLKSENLANLARELNLDLDSFVFIDDSSLEIAEVECSLPQVLCIKMPQNAKEFFTVKGNWAFDHKLTVDTGINRTKLYKLEGKRQKALSNYSDYIAFLEMSQLVVLINPVTQKQEKNIDRISELSQRTNQFNLFPSPKDTNSIKNSLVENKSFMFSVEASDIYGEYGLIGAAGCQIQSNTLRIDCFFISCRAFGRGIEYQFIKYIAQFALDKKLDTLKITFKKTEKNLVAQSFLKFLSLQFNSSIGNINLELAQETILTFATNELAGLDVKKLLRIDKKLNDDVDFSMESKSINKTFFVNNEKKYLLTLQRITQSLDFLYNKFFFDEKKLLTIIKNEDKITTICNYLLGDTKKDVPLIYLGLDSLKATELSYYLYETTNLNLTITQLLSEKTTVQTLVTYLEQCKDENLDKLNVVIPSPSGQDISLSFQEKRLWLAEQKELKENDNIPNYTMVVCYSIENLQINFFRNACQQLLQRHDAFGCYFSVQRGKLVKTILPIEDRKLAFEVTEIEDTLTIKSIILKEANKNFLMNEAPLIRFSVFTSSNCTVSPRNYILIRIHHGIFDALSLQNTLEDLSKIYQAALSLNTHSVEPSNYQYSHYIQYQNNVYNTKNYQEEANIYWSKLLSVLEVSSEIPYDKVVKSFKPFTERLCKRYDFSVPTNDLVALQQLAQLTRTTNFNLLLSLFAILISTYTYEDKIGIVTATTGRSSPIFHKVIGFFVNLLILPFDLEKNISFIEYAKSNYRTFLESISYQEFPVEKVQEILKKQGISNSLESPAFIYQNYKSAILNLDGEQAVLEIPEKPILYDLRNSCRFGGFTLFVREENKKMSCRIEYAEDLYSENFITRIANNFLHLVHTIGSNPGQRLHDISCVSQEEKTELLSLSKGPVYSYPENKTLISIFKDHVLNNPNAIALCHNNTVLTYKELDQLSTKLAKKLSINNISNKENVGLYFENPHLFFISELAILKLSATFIPLAATDPIERLYYIVKDAGIKHIVCDRNFVILNDLNNICFINIQKEDLEHEVQVINPLIHSTLNDRACILYTSGSTGHPKGVILKQKGIVRVVRSTDYIQITPEDKVVQSASLAFDAAQLECWLAWSNGASLIILDNSILLDAKLLEEKFLTHKVTVLWLTAGLFHQYAYVKPAIFSKLNYLLIGGDAIDKKAVQEILNCGYGCPNYILDCYGPTEATIFTTACLITKEILNNYVSIPIGTPINNTEVYLLNRFKKLAPLGAKGQLAIGNDAVAEGYLNKDQLQNEHFVIQSGLSPTTLYLSGDLVKWVGPSNQLLFSGRLDGEQIKKQGYLVSLSEIEAALIEHPAIKQVAVLAKVVNAENKLLIAFYIRNKDFLISEEHSLIEYLNTQLPPFMVPDFYQEIENFPITRNGKLDKKGLLQISRCQKKGNSTEVLTDNQKKLADLFKLVLTFPLLSEYQLGLDDSFFNCGGTSILAVQLIYEIEKLLGIRLSFDVLRQNPSVRSLDKFLTSKNEVKSEQNSSFVLLKKGEEHLPAIVFIHPAGGALYCYEKLIEKTSLNNSFFGIEDSVLLQGLQQNLSIQEMAENYILQIEKNVKKPFILAGYSFGGMLALEIASQLEKKQNDLIAVILLDTWIVSAASEPIQYQLKQEVLCYFTEVREKICASRKHLVNQIEAMELRYRYLQDLGFSFMPKKLESTQVILLKADTLDSSFKDMAVESDNNFLLNFVNKHLFQRLYISGTHYTILEKEEHLEETAKVFSHQATHLKSLTTDNVGIKKSSFFFSAANTSEKDNSMQYRHLNRRHLL